MKILGTNNIDEVAQALFKGAVIVYPTETSYGIGCDATNETAIRALLKIKVRDEEKGLVVLVSSADEASLHVEVSKKAKELMNTYWPGPLNLVLPKLVTSTISSLCAREGLQALRVSSDPFVMKLLESFARPLVSTSANISGDRPLFSAKEAIEVFSSREHQPDYLVDAGSIDERSGSTVLLVRNNLVRVLRQGEITL